MATSTLTSVTATPERWPVTFMLPTDDAIAVGEEMARRFGLPYWQFSLTATDANRFALRLSRQITGVKNFHIETVSMRCELRDPVNWPWPVPGPPPTSATDPAMMASPTSEKSQWAIPDATRSPPPIHTGRQDLPARDRLARAPKKSAAWAMFASHPPAR